jgi:hypothetical protein
MGIDTKIDEDAGLRIHTVSGELTFEMLSAMLEATYADPQFRPEHNVLWEVRGAALTNFSSTEVRNISELVQGQWRGAKAALVVGSDADYGMARMYEMHLASGSSGEVRVFRDLEEAHAWVTK